MSQQLHTLPVIPTDPDSGNIATIEMAFSPEEDKSLEIAANYSRLKTQFQLNSLGELKLINEEPGIDDTQQDIAPLRDNKGSVIPGNYYLETENLKAAIELAIKEGLGVSIIGELTSAVKAFGDPRENYNYNENLNGIINIKPKAAALPLEITQRNVDQLLEQSPESSSHISIEKDKNGKYTVTVGGGFTPDQINQIIRAKLGPEYIVPLDLTTKKTARILSVAATNGTGPNRISPDKLVEELELVTTEGVQVITDPEEIKEHIGRLGLTGAITKLKLKVLKTPGPKFVIPIPVKGARLENWQQQTSKFLARLQGFTELQINEDGSFHSKDFKHGIIDGIEIIRKPELKNMIPEETSNQQVTREDLSKLARRELKQLRASDSELMLMVTGYSSDHLSQLFFKEETELNDFEKALLEIFMEGFNGLPDSVIGEISSIYCNIGDIEKLEEMREHIPEAAREKARDTAESEGETLKFSKSMDINFRITPEARSFLTPEQIQDFYHQLLEPFIIYQNKIKEIAKVHQFDPININFNLYGHLNPQNMDIHARATVIAGIVEKPLWVDVREKVLEAREKIFASLKGLTESTMPVNSEDGSRKKIQVIEVSYGEKGPITEDGFKLLSEFEKYKITAKIAKAGKNLTFRTPNYLKDYLPITT